MKAWLFIILVAFTVACGGASDGPEEAPEPVPGSYAWPDYASLLAAAKIDDFDLADGEPLAHVKAMPACQAVWAAVDKAGSNGLLELYGFEWFGGGAGGYQAIFIMHTGKGAKCIYAYDEVHEFRTDPLTVPSHPVDLAALDKLRRRVGAEVPFPIPASSQEQVVDGSIICGGSYVALHVYQDGQPYTALWFQPRDHAETNRWSVAENARAYPVRAVLGAIWAAAPPGLFPFAHDEYDDLPGDRKWEADDAEFYKRMPAYE